MTQIVNYALVWGDKVVPEDVKASFDHPLAVFHSPWVWSEDGPVLELSTPLGVTWYNLHNDLYGLLEFGALGYVLLVDPHSDNFIVKMELIRPGPIIVTTTLTVEMAKAAATKEIYFPT